MKKLKKQLEADIKFHQETVKVLSDKIDEMNTEINEANSNARYYKGRLEEANEKIEEERKSLQSERHEINRQWEHQKDELSFLRNFVMMLTLPESAQKELDRKLNEDRYGVQPGMDTMIPSNPHVRRR